MDSKKNEIKSYLEDVLLASIANIASANIMVALLIRQDYVVNILFGICWSVPLSTPLRIRRLLAKIYEFGGVHSGAAVCSVLWFCLFTGLLTRDFVISSRKSGLPTKDSVVLTITYILLWTLITLTVTAYPRFRIWSHNTFENFHRWGGWFTLALFWVELIIFTILNKDTKPLGIMLVKFPAFWFLTISTVHAILPWIRLHKLHVIPEKLSNHAIRLHFKDKVPNYVGLRISDAPLKEWHSFACIPARDGCGGSLLISNAGDWTEKTVTDPKPYYWVKGVPSTGVLCMAQIFRSVIIITTGSGIGPCLAVIQDVPARGTKVRVIWSTPDPWHTYGDEICLAVQDVDKNAVIHDTRKYGRPDMVKMAYDMYKEGEAEAVFMISNPKMTKKLVYGLESRGVPAFGPIWDS
ncbi:hypothetical protein B0J14DRAFT_686978 [Halenospora varia]|nr:hypothetical protein B0J14DRAFT_686978 [Halenospora varia]